MQGGGFKRRNRRNSRVSPQNAALLPAIMRAHYQAIIRYNIGIYKAPFSKDACKVRNTIQKANKIKINTRKCKIGKDMIYEYKYDFN